MRLLKTISHLVCDRLQDIEEFNVGVVSTRLAAYNGFLFYGTHYDMYACPIDGNPETDSISLMEQFAEEEKHEIECMSDSRYRYSMPKGITFEDGKIIAKITVCKGAYNWLFNLLRGVRPDAEDHDILLEIDLKTDTCRMLYSTENSHARILGYKSGMIYCFYDGIIYQESLEEGNREHIFRLSEGEWRDYWKKSDSPLVTYWCEDYLFINIAEKAECIYLPD